MPPSSSKQKRLAEKAAKASSNQKNGSSTLGTDSTTDTGSMNGGSSVGTPVGTGTPMTSLSVNASREDLTSMAKLALATDRSASGVLVSDSKGRDVKIESYTLSFHGRLLFEGAEIALNYGQRCVNRLDGTSFVIRAFAQIQIWPSGRKRFWKG